MKKIALLLAISASLSLSAPRTTYVESCNRDVCATYVLHDVKKAEQMTDFSGRRFVRVTFSDGSLLDIGGDRVSVRK